MPPNTPVFLLGLGVGTVLLIIGLLLGYWFGRRAAPAGDVVDRQQFLSFLRNLSTWTTEFSGDVSKYQSQLTMISEQVREGTTPPREEIEGLLAQIMAANQQLQQRLDTAEEKLEEQTDQISNYLVEARTDGLTGLFNRRAYDKALDQLYADWTEKGQAFSLGLIDIDHFKQINDTHGHPAGDAVLQQVAAMLQTELHGSVCIARYGGEEFAMLTTASAEQAADALDSLRAAVCEKEIIHDGTVIPVSLSGGASMILEGDAIGNLVRRADEALYAAKLGGRNRVYLHDGQQCRLITKVDASAAGGAAAQDDEPLNSAEKQAADEKLDRMQERLRRIVEEESQRMVQR